MRDEKRGCQQEWKEPSRGTGSQGSFNKHDSQCNQNVINQQAVRPPRQKVNDLKNSAIRESDTLIIETQRRDRKSEGISNSHGQSNFKEAELNKPDDVEESKEEEELRAARAAAARAKLRAALGIGISSATKKQESAAAAEEGGQPQTSAGAVDRTCETGRIEEAVDPGKAERIAATKAKMREALLSAALAEVGRGGGGGKRSLSMKEGKADGVGQGRVEGGGGLERRASTGRRLSTQAAPTGGRRSSGAVEAQNTIWEFFEEGRKKGTCKTCGYVVGIKHNHGGLTRFQQADFWNQTYLHFLQAPQSCAPARVQRIHGQV